MKPNGFYFLSAGMTVLLGLAAFAGSPDTKKTDAQAAEFFEAKVRPILANKCFSCHGDKVQQSGVRLDSLAAMMKGNSAGPSIVAGNPEKSPLIQVIHYDGKVKMPPTGKLKPEEIAALTEWVKMGAPWPGEKVSEAAAQAAKNGDYVITDAQRKFWSFRPIAKQAVPAVTNKAWCKTPIDNFILTKLAKKGLTPAPYADRRTLIRRATFDLIGLPPTMEEIDAFVADKSPDAFSKVVDRLLEDPRYGERWGRLWLDIARYADTKGYVFVDDRVYHNGYTYRDYVIRAFNEDLPYDQFIIQQLAADKLPLLDDKRPLAALGFLTVGRRFLNNPPDIIDDRIDVTTRGFMGLTVNCARCHDHKFDPIPTKDYYSLYGIFASSFEPNPPPIISPKNIAEPYEAHNARQRDAENTYNSTVRQQIRILRGIVAKTPDVLSAEIKQILQSLRLDQFPTDQQLSRMEPSFEAAAVTSLKELRTTISNLKKTAPLTPEFAMGMQDMANPVTPHVFIRGNPNNQGAEIPRQFLAILSGENRTPFTQGSGRLELAQAIASKDNPLTSRVMVNRIWRYHFGQALVRTPSDFGTRGELPTHPELLDYLATQFMDNGWSIKKLHKMIMLSSAYQQSSDYIPKSFSADPENRLVWHMNRRRLDLEQLRDSLLFASGKLDAKMGGPSVELTTMPYTTRRTVYGFIDRQNLQGLYRTFDFASPDATSAQRFSTTVPQQALFMMNSPFIVEQAKALSRRTEFDAAKDDKDRIKVAYRLILERAPLPEEITFGLRYLQQTQQQTALVSYESKPQSGQGLTTWERYLQALLMTNEFSFVD
jgi:mono/diheme cytochrome c family protein